MSKITYSLAKLLKELQAAEGIVGHHKKTVQVMEKGSTSASVNKEKKKKKKALKQAAQSKKLKPKVSEGKCFTCGQKGHWKDDFSKKPQTQNGNNSGMPLAFVVETCLMTCTTST